MFIQSWVLVVTKYLGSVTFHLLIICRIGTQNCPDQKIIIQFTFILTISNNYLHFGHSVPHSHQHHHSVVGGCTAHHHLWDTLLLITFVETIRVDLWSNLLVTQGSSVRQLLVVKLAFFFIGKVSHCLIYPVSSCCIKIEAAERATRGALHCTYPREKLVKNVLLLSYNTE